MKFDDGKRPDCAIKCSFSHSDHKICVTVARSGTPLYSRPTLPQLSIELKQDQVTLSLLLVVHILQ